MKYPLNYCFKIKERAKKTPTAEKYKTNYLCYLFKHGSCFLS